MFLGHTESEQYNFGSIYRFPFTHLKIWETKHLGYVTACSLIARWLVILLLTSSYGWFLFFFFFFLVFLGAHPQHESSQARCRIRAIAASLHRSHSNSRFERRLQPILTMLTAMPDPWPTEWGKESNPQPHGYYSGSLRLSYNGNSHMRDS